MKSPTIAAAGGCHIAGYPIGSKQSFPHQLNDLLGGQLVAEAPYIRFVDLPQHLPALLDKHPSHLVMQFGNYEFSTNFIKLVRQCGLRRWTKEAAKDKIVPLDIPCKSLCLLMCLRVACMSVGIAALWLFSPSHRRSFRALKQCMQQHPAAAFIFLSPFPTLHPGDNLVRRFGGWLLRHRLPGLPNCHWVDSHDIIRPARELFVDSLHLNEQAHRAIAYGVAANIISHADQYSLVAA